MKLPYIVPIAILAGTCALHAQERKKIDLSAPAPLSMSKSLPANGTLVMEVNIGDVHVVRSESAKTIRLEIDSQGFYDDETAKSWVRRFDVSGDRASIELKFPKHNDHHSGPTAVVYLPAQTDLKLDLGIGDLNIKDIEGNKDLHVGIGDLTVSVNDGSQYNSIHTGTKIGDANDNVFREHSSGFFPKTNHTSTQGKFKLVATVGIGDVNVSQD